MRNKYILMICFALIMIVVAGCGSNNDVSNSDNSEYPDGPITIIVAFDAGGGTDTGARILAKQLEEEIGVPVVIENKPGSSGAVGWQELSKSNSDGYTLGYINVPAINTSYINPEGSVNYGLEDFTFISSHVVDQGVWSIKKDDDRFDNMEELIEYAKDNKVTVTSNGVGTENHIIALEMNDELGTNFEPVHFTGTGEAKASVLGGHTDVLISKVGEVFTSQDELNTLTVFGSERVDQLPDVPTLKESIDSDLEFYSLRTIGGPADLDEQIVSKIKDELDKVYESEEHIEEMQEMGLNIDGRFGEELEDVLYEEEDKIISVKDVLGW